MRSGGSRTDDVSSMDWTGGNTGAEAMAADSSSPVAVPSPGRRVAAGEGMARVAARMTSRAAASRWARYHAWSRPSEATAAGRAAWRKSRLDALRAEVRMVGAIRRWVLECAADRARGRAAAGLCMLQSRAERWLDGVATRRAGGRVSVRVGLAACRPGHTRIHISADMTAVAAFRCILSFWRRGGTQSNFYPIWNVDLR